MCNSLKKGLLVDMRARMQTLAALQIKTGLIFALRARLQLILKFICSWTLLKWPQPLAVFMR